MIWIFVHKDGLERNRLRDADEPCLNIVEDDGPIERVHGVTLCCPRCQADAAVVHVVPGRTPLIGPHGVLGVRAWVEPLGEIVTQIREVEML